MVRTLRWLRLCGRIHGPAIFVIGFLLTMGLFFFSPILNAAENPTPVLLTSEERAWLMEHPDKLQLSFNVDFPPIDYVSKTGEFSGLGADVIAMVEQRLGVSFHKTPTDKWSRSLAALEKGECAILPAIAPNSARERFAFFTPPYARIPVVIISAQSSGKDMTLDDFAGKRVAVVTGLPLQNLIKKQTGDRLLLVPMPDIPQALRATSFGQVDAYVENLVVATHYIKSERIPNLEVVGSTQFSLPLSIGVSRQYPLLFSSIKKALAEIPESDLETLRNKWISLQIYKGIRPETKRLLMIIAAFTALLLLSLAGISYFLKQRLNEKVANLKNAQQELMEQTERLHLAMDATQAGIWDYYLPSETIFLSTQWFNILGYEQSGKMYDITELGRYFHPDDRPAVDQTVNDYIDAGGHGELEIESRLRQADGAWRWVLSKGHAVAWDANGSPTRIIGLDLSIQNIKEAQEQMARSESKFRAIFEHAPYAIVINSLEDGTYLDANRTFLEMWGISKDELITLPRHSAIYASDEHAATSLDAIVKTGWVQNREATVKKPDGTQSHVIYSSVLLEIQGQKQIITITVDVTERKRAEEALRESERKLRSIFEAMTDVILILDTNGRYIEIAPTDTDLLLRPPDELLGKSIWDVFPPEKATEFDAAIREALSMKQQVTLVYELMTGERQVWFEASISPLSSDRVIWVAKDITDRKRYEREREKLQNQLLQSQKLEAVAILAGGVAHDFNNMLGAIIGYTELSLDQLPPDDPNHKNLVSILDAAKRSANLTRQLLTFARKQTVQPVLLDINQSIEDTLKMLRRLIGENIDLVWHPSSERCPVTMDPSQLDQILVNLCVNARDSIADVGKIAIKTGIVSFDETSCQYQTDCAPGNYVQLAVSDNGSGMDQETLDHVFEPFFTTKGLGRGTGLGLATIYGIVKQSQGFIHVYSELGAGTTINIYIPLQLTDVGVKQTKTGDEIPSSRGENILLVEDDPVLRDIGQEMLQRLGYNVLSAATPGEALHLASQDDITIHLVLTDLVMPEMNGRELFEHLLEIRPQINHLFMSGYAADIIEHRGILDKEINFLQKPFTLESLAVKVREAIDPN